MLSGIIAKKADTPGIENSPLISFSTYFESIIQQIVSSQSGSTPSFDSSTQLMHIKPKNMDSEFLVLFQPDATVAPMEIKNPTGEQGENSYQFLFIPINSSDTISSTISEKVFQKNSSKNENLEQLLSSIHQWNPGLLKVPFLMTIHQDNTTNSGSNHASDSYRKIIFDFIPLDNEFKIPNINEEIPSLQNLSEIISRENGKEFKNASKNVPTMGEILHNSDTKSTTDNTSNLRQNEALTNLLFTMENNQYAKSDPLKLQSFPQKFITSDNSSLYRGNNRKNELLTTETNASSSKSKIQSEISLDIAGLYPDNSEVDSVFAHPTNRSGSIPLIDLTRASENHDINPSGKMSLSIQKTLEENLPLISAQDSSSKNATGTEENLSDVVLKTNLKNNKLVLELPKNNAKVASNTSIILKFNELSKALHSLIKENGNLFQQKLPGSVQIQVEINGDPTPEGTPTKSIQNVVRSLVRLLQKFSLGETNEFTGKSSREHGSIIRGMHHQLKLINSVTSHLNKKVFSDMPVSNSPVQHKELEPKNFISEKSETFFQSFSSGAAQTDFSLSTKIQSELSADTKNASSIFKNNSSPVLNGETKKQNHKLNLQSSENLTEYSKAQTEFTTIHDVQMETIDKMTQMKTGQKEPLIPFKNANEFFNNQDFNSDTSSPVDSGNGPSIDRNHLSVKDNDSILFDQNLLEQESVEEKPKEQPNWQMNQKEAKIQHSDILTLKTPQKVVKQNKNKNTLNILLDSSKNSSQKYSTNSSFLNKTSGKQKIKFIQINHNKSNHQDGIYPKTGKSIQNLNNQSNESRLVATEPYNVNAKYNISDDSIVHQKNNKVNPSSASESVSLDQQNEKSIFTDKINLVPGNEENIQDKNSVSKDKQPSTWGHNKKLNTIEKQKSGFESLKYSSTMDKKAHLNQTTSLFGQKPEMQHQSMKQHENDINQNTLHNHKETQPLSTHKNSGAEYNIQPEIKQKINSPLVNGTSHSDLQSANNANSSNGANTNSSDSNSQHPQQFFSQQENNSRQHNEANKSKESLKIPDVSLRDGITEFHHRIVSKTSSTQHTRDIHRIIQEITRQISLKIDRQKADIQIRVIDEDLGQLKIKLQIDRDVAKLLVITESDESRQILQKHAPELKENLAQQGIKVEKTDFWTVQEKHGQMADQMGNSNHQSMHGRGHNKGQMASSPRNIKAQNLEIKELSPIRKGASMEGSSLDVMV